MEPITKVVFRKFKNSGAIIALFPELKENKYFVLSYMYEGQHGEADYTHVIQSTTKCSPEEYKPLYDELTNMVGYNLKVLQKSKIKY